MGVEDIISCDELMEVDRRQAVLLGNSGRRTPIVNNRASHVAKMEKVGDTG